MIRFRTQFEARKQDLTLNPRLPVAAVGSCFAANVCSKMEESLWEAVNTLGTLYNPVSIEKALRLALLSESPEPAFAETLFENGGAVRSWLFDSRFAAPGRQEAVANFIDRCTMMRSAVETGKTIIVTFGTAWCYSLGEASIPNTVGNCHKQPQNLFSRFRLTVGEVVELWTRLLEDLAACYPGINVVFTVSPVRHLKDGFEGNARSKAILLLAAEELCGRFVFSHYFPAFEILNDDLRDYRFYASDLVHPSETGVEYIWEKFRETFLDSEGRDFLKKGNAEWKTRNHRPILRS